MVTPSSQPNKAIAIGLRLIKIRPRSEKELRDRLARGGFASSTVEETVATLKSRGLIDDAKFARYFAAGKAALKPMGRGGLIQELKARGIEGIQAQDAVEKALGGQDELTLALSLAEKRLGTMGGLSSQAVQRRLFGYLTRRGFSSETVYRVLREFGDAPKRDTPL